MPAVKNPLTEKGHGKAVIVENMKNHDNDPFVLKKVAAAKEKLNQPGMAEQLKKLAEKSEEKHQ
jgi:hypothetical protein